MQGIRVMARQPDERRITDAVAQALSPLDCPPAFCPT
jgi:hypothetical protein